MSMLIKIQLSLLMFLALVMTNDQYLSEEISEEEIVISGMNLLKLLPSLVMLI